MGNTQLGVPKFFLARGLKRARRQKSADPGFLCREFRDRLKPVPKLPLAIDKSGFVGAQPCAPTGLNQNQVGFCDTPFSLRL